jgi:hypothetical protein
MPKMSLTARSVDSAKPPEKGQVDYFDKAFPVFGFRMGRSGKKTYFVMTRLAADVPHRLLGRVFFAHGFLPHLRSLRSLR